MTKFLNIPVTSEQYQLVAINNIALIEQATTTTVTTQPEQQLLQLVLVLHTQESGPKCGVQLE